MIVKRKMRKIEGFWFFSTNSRGKTGGRAPANGHVRSAAARIRQGLGWGFFNSLYLGLVPAAGGWEGDLVDQANADVEAELQIRVQESDGHLLEAIGGSARSHGRRNV